LSAQQSYVVPPLSVRIKEELRAVTLLSRAEDVPGAEILRRFSAKYGNSVIPQRSVYEWITMFESSRTKLFALWVPEQLAGEHKRNRLTICQGLLNLYRNKGDVFLDALSLRTRPGSTVMLQKANLRALNGNT
jgi:hypothetical protein